MPRFPNLERMSLGQQPAARDPNAPSYWIRGPIYRLDSLYRPPVYYRAEDVPTCESCGTVNTTRNISGAICMGCFLRRMRPESPQLPPPPPPPPPPEVPKFTKADAAKILGVPWPGATREDVVDAYRALVLETHTDRGGDTKRLIEILKARDRMLGTTVQVPR